MSGEPAALTIIGVPAQGGGRPYEVARGPGALRAAGLVAALAEGHDVIDAGDVRLGRPSSRRDEQSGLINPQGLSRLVVATAAAVRQARWARRFPIIVGGDCPALLGGLAGQASSAAVGLLHIDGHEDAYLPRESPSGAWSDCEIAFAIGLAPFSWDRALADLQPLTPPRALAVLGARDAEEIDSHGARRLGDPSLVVDDRGLTADPTWTAESAIAHISTGAECYWVHVDVDVLSSQALASTIHPVAGGIDFPTLLTVLARALSHPACCGLSLTTYNPDLDTDGRDALTLVDFIVDACAKLPLA